MKAIPSITEDEVMTTSEFGLTDKFVDSEQLSNETTFPFEESNTPPGQFSVWDE